MLDFSFFNRLQCIFIFDTQRSNSICSIFIYLSYSPNRLNDSFFLLPYFFSPARNIFRKLFLYLLNFLDYYLITCFDYSFSFIDCARIYMILSYFRRAIYKVLRFLCFYDYINLILLLRSFYYSLALFIVY
jgi:hypothetical protein